MTLFQNKYRIEPARLRGWNYALEGSYFLTICTYNREFILGKISKGKMDLSNQYIHELTLQLPLAEYHFFP